MAVIVIFLISMYICVAIGEPNFAPNPAWKNTDITISTDDRIAIAKDCIDKTISMIVDTSGKLKLEDTNYGPTMGNFFTQIAKFDMAAKQTTYHQQLLDFFPQALAFRPGFQHGK
ncbi:hypothetical protein AAF712_000914 [Marasmius tenuissimus]|uniref:Uncharacterized protein n=1 Tax=Marasmius tenuissimus TaxID=585030 RepID=A0ABR3ADH8_9AGAR